MNILKYLSNIPKKLNPFKKKEETVLTVLKAYLNIAVGEIYSCAKGFRKITGLPSIKKVGIINLENELSIMNEGCFNMEKELTLLHSEHRNLQEELHKDEYKYYDLVTLKTKEEMRNTIKERTYIPKLEFEETNTSKVIELIEDDIKVGLKTSVPFRCKPKEMELVNKLGNELNRLIVKEAGAKQRQLKRGKIKSLKKAKTGYEPIEPKQKNILVYASLLLILFIKVSIICGLVSEGVIVKNIAFNNLNYTIEESYLFASILLVITFVISRYRFNSAERLLRTVREQWWVTGAFTFLFLLQLISAGILSNYNFQRHSQLELVKSERMQLAIKQGELVDFEEDEDREEIVELQQEIDVLKSNINVRLEMLDSPPVWTIYTGYVVVGIMSVLTLFFTIFAKVLGEVYAKAYKLERSIRKKRRCIAKIEPLYDYQVHKLLTAYDLRHQLVFYVSKKHVLEMMIAQESSLKSNEYYKAYSIQ